jgi:protein-disulfide isomerase
MEDWFYTHQPQMTPPSVKQAVREIAGVTDFDVKYAATLELVKSDIQFGYQVSVAQTPTFFINGVKLEGMVAPQYFDNMIAYELQHAPK